MLQTVFGLSTIEKDEERVRSGGVQSFVISDMMISRMHVKIECIGEGKLSVRDLGSMNGTYLKDPDEDADYELVAGREFIIGDTTMILAKCNADSSEFCLLVLDGFLAGLQFVCKCDYNNSFFFRKGDPRAQMASHD